MPRHRATVPHENGFVPYGGLVKEERLRATWKNEFVVRATWRPRERGRLRETIKKRVSRSCYMTASWKRKASRCVKKKEASRHKSQANKQQSLASVVEHWIAEARSKKIELLVLGIVVLTQIIYGWQDRNERSEKNIARSQDRNARTNSCVQSWVRNAYQHLRNTYQHLRNAFLTA